MTRIAAIVTQADRTRLRELTERCAHAARAGASVTLFFRDETIPLICREDVAGRLVPVSFTEAVRVMHGLIQELAAAGEVRCYACSSSMYLWGVTAQDLVPALSGVRGLIAFLADDLPDATEVLCS